MKKFTKTVSALLFGLILFSTTTAYASVTIATIAAAVAAAKAAYDLTPEATYHVIYYFNGDNRDDVVHSCKAALAIKDVALENGATKVRITTDYPTAWGSCKNKEYK